MVLNGRDKALLAGVLRVADSFWVLGHWYIKVMMNGRCLQDFNALASFTQDTLGFTRFLFRYAEETFELPEYQLEFGRDRESVHAIHVLYEPPQSWGDFVVCAYMATAAAMEELSSYTSGANSGLATLAGQVRETAYFHLMYFEGWADAVTPEERVQAQDALVRRLPLVLRWFSDEGGTVRLLADEGIRSRSVDEAQSAFLERMGELAEVLKVELPEPVEPALPGDWDARRRRSARSLPDQLWGLMIPQTDEARLGRRPLAVSIEDRLDLF